MTFSRVIRYRGVLYCYKFQQFFKLVDLYIFFFYLFSKPCAENKAYFIYMNFWPRYFWTEHKLPHTIYVYSYLTIITLPHMAFSCSPPINIIMIILYGIILRLFGGDEFWDHNMVRIFDGKFFWKLNSTTIRRYFLKKFAYCGPATRTTLTLHYATRVPFVQTHYLCRKFKTL